MEERLSNIIFYLCKAISLIFVPMFLPVYIFTLVLIFLPEVLQVYYLSDKLMFLGYIFFTTTLIPMVAIMIAYRYKIISEPEMFHKRERLVPQLITFGCYAGVAFMMGNQLGYQSFSFIMMMMVSMIILIITLITFFWKISAHSTGIAGMTGIILALHNRYEILPDIMILAALFLLTGLVMSSRLYLGIHTLAQVTAGAVLGFGMGYLTGVLV